MPSARHLVVAELEPQERGHQDLPASTRDHRVEGLAHFVRLGGFGLFAHNSPFYAGRTAYNLA